MGTVKTSVDLIVAIISTEGNLAESEEGLIYPRKEEKRPNRKQIQKPSTVTKRRGAIR